MNKRFAEVVDLIDFEELLRMKKDLDDGGFAIDKIVTEKIKAEIRKKKSVCCICNAEISPSSHSRFTLMFGPDDMKRKASFCGMDCMEYFIKNLKEMCNIERKVR